MLKAAYYTTSVGIRSTPISPNQGNMMDKLQTVIRPREFQSVGFMLDVGSSWVRQSVTSGDTSAEHDWPDYRRPKNLTGKDPHMGFVACETSPPGPELRHHDVAELSRQHVSAIKLLDAFPQRGHIESLC